MNARPDIPRTAMILSAGYGTRMQPITNHLPKPLVELRGRSLLDRILDRLDAVGVETAVVNLHHLGHMIEAHLKDRKTPKIVFSPEDSILETGGGIRQALPLLGDRPFYALNGDVCWLDGLTPALARLAAAWDSDKMDLLMLLEPTVYAFGYERDNGDYSMDPEGRLQRRGEGEVAPFIYAGIQIIHPRLFEGSPEGAFSMNLLFDKAEADGRLWGLRHDGHWYHVGTPESLEAVDAALYDLTAFPLNK